MAYIRKGYNKRHGMSGTKLYWVWWAMIQRTTNPKEIGYKNYGGRGISVCIEWRDPSAFFLWALANGYHEGLELNRKDNDKNYCPEICDFVTRSRNCSNRRVGHNAGISYIPKRKVFQIQLTRDKIHYYGVSDHTIEEAHILRDKLLKKLGEL